MPLFAAATVQGEFDRTYQLFVSSSAPEGFSLQYGLAMINTDLNHARMCDDRQKRNSGTRGAGAKLAWICCNASIEP